MKYIDAEKLKAELEKPKSELQVGNYYLDNSEQAVGYESALIDFELLIEALQEEQSEVDLKNEDELEREINNAGMAMTEHNPSWKEVEQFARHFYELGKLNARKEENK